MELDENGDDETPWEEWPGYIGHSWDGELFPGPALELLGRFDWGKYRDMAPKDDREIVLNLASGTKVVKFNVYEDIGDLLSKLPSVDVVYDGQSDDHPASGSGCVFTIAEGSSLKAVEAEVSTLFVALKADLDTLLVG